MLQWQEGGAQKSLQGPYVYIHKGPEFLISQRNPSVVTENGEFKFHSSVNFTKCCVVGFSQVPFLWNIMYPYATGCEHYLKYNLKNLVVFFAIALEYIARFIFTYFDPSFGKKNLIKLVFISL